MVFILDLHDFDLQNFTITWYREPRVEVYFLHTFANIFDIIIIRRRPRTRSDAPRIPSRDATRRDAPMTTTATTVTTTTTTTRRGYADHLGTDDARHHTACRIRNVTGELQLFIFILSYFFISPIIFSALLLEMQNIISTFVRKNYTKITVRLHNIYAS